MKLIFAIIRNAKMNETKQALSEAGLPSFTALSVMGRGRARGVGPNYEKAIADPETSELIKEVIPDHRLKSKRLITLVVTDDRKDEAINTIISVNKTGNSGDGKIFVMETFDSLRIRTGERGNSTLD
jgi:nitrogen regulatory protein PII 2